MQPLHPPSSCLADDGNVADCVHHERQIKLWYADTVYELKLGMLVTIWTPHIAQAPWKPATMQNANLTTSIFPERDNTCRFVIQEDQSSILYRMPLGHRDGRDLDGLTTLKRFNEGGHKVPGSSVLVCVKSVGAKKNGKFPQC